MGFDGEYDFESIDILKFESDCEDMHSKLF